MEKIVRSAICFHFIPVHVGDIDVEYIVPWLRGVGAPSGAHLNCNIGNVLNCFATFLEWLQ